MSLVEIMEAKTQTKNLNVESIKSIATRGAVWVSITAALAIPIGYYRNWILGKTDVEGQVVGNYAVVMIFFRIITTFVLFGGFTVVTNYLPKINDKQDKSAFLMTYGAISGFFVMIFLAIIFIQPKAVEFLTRQPIDNASLWSLAVLTPVIVLSQIVIFSLAGIMNFRLSSLLAQLQVFLVTIVATVVFFFYRDFMTNNSLFVITVTVCLANIIVFIYGGRRVFQFLGKLRFKYLLPEGFWKYSCLIHMNTLCTFAYMNIDQIFVLTVLGVKELGAYFVLLQCAQMIRFVPERIGQVMLASFSHFVGANEHDQLKRAYIRLCRLILVFSTPIALILILFSRQIGHVFGSFCATKHLYLVLLAVVVNIGCLGTINSMLIMSKERPCFFTINNLILILAQLLTTFLLINKAGVYGVIIGKFIGTLLGQIGLFLIIWKALPEIKLLPPKEYWVSQIMVTGTAIFVFFVKGTTLIHSLGIFVVAVILFLIVIGFNIDEVVTLFKRKKAVNSVSESV